MILLYLITIPTIAVETDITFYFKLLILNFYADLIIQDVMCCVEISSSYYQPLSAILNYPIFLIIEIVCERH